MLQLADAAERQGTLMRAAQTLVAASLPGRHGLLPWAKEDALTQRGLQLLETKLDGDLAANELELGVLSRVLTAHGAKRQHALKRMKALRQRRAAAGIGQASLADLLEEAGQAGAAHLYAALKILKMYVPGRSGCAFITPPPVRPPPLEHACWPARPAPARLLPDSIDPPARASSAPPPVMDSGPPRTPRARSPQRRSRRWRRCSWQR